MSLSTGTIEEKNERRDVSHALTHVHCEKAPSFVTYPIRSYPLDNARYMRLVAVAVLVPPKGFNEEATTIFLVATKQSPMSHSLSSTVTLPKCLGDTDAAAGALPSPEAVVSAGAEAANPRGISLHSS